VLLKEFQKSNRNTVCRYPYIVLLSPHRARQFNCIEGLYLPAHRLFSCGAQYSDKRNTLSNTLIPNGRTQR